MYVVTQNRFWSNIFANVFSAGQHIAYMLSALYAIARPSVRPSVFQTGES